jgi:hypothetical protein
VEAEPTEKDMTTPIPKHLPSEAEAEDRRGTKRKKEEEEEDEWLPPPGASCFFSFLFHRASISFFSLSLSLSLFLLLMAQTKQEMAERR